MKVRKLDIDYLRSILRYDAETGDLWWLVRNDVPDRVNKRLAGKRAFTSINDKGYAHGGIHGVSYLAHRVSWALYYGVWPSRHIDHINGCRADNRIKNLREATNSENLMNRGKQSNNTSGYKGVYYRKDRSKWQAHIHLNGRNIYLGRFNTAEDAHKAYINAAMHMHGEFANLGVDNEN